MFNINLAPIYRVLVRQLPQAVVIGIALAVAAANFNPSLHYAGWDNILAELNFGRYARSVLFGSWLEHQALGAPAAQAHLAEIPRLPILFALQALLPVNLVRYIFVMAMYLVGGMGMYAYLTKYWLNTYPARFKRWLATMGATLYLLHILTLQQFYIVFEMFAVQFAFLPWLLIVVHRLVERVSARTVLLFIGAQLLLAPSAHTPTVFYLGALVSVVYAAMVGLDGGNWRRTLRIGLLVSGLTLAANAYWILPNVYFTVNNAEYVHQSRENQLFAPESIWSVREAGTIANFLTGRQYLFNWKVYSFSDRRFEFIFNDWADHLSQPGVNLSLTAIGGITVLGVVTTALARDKGHKRWAVIGVYLVAAAFIWNGILPTRLLVDTLYHSDSFREAFRNPMTKLSIIYSLVSVVLFVGALELAVGWLDRQRWLKISGRWLAAAVIVATTSIFIYTAWPSFQGHFISDKLNIAFPQQYSQLFLYLQQQPEDQRVLQLPQLSSTSWEYYDWQFLGEGNGYQGQGFYFFGFPQSYLARDFDRWGETSDFFYHQLKHALDRRDAVEFNQIIDQYGVDLVVVDESKIDPFNDYNHDLDHQLLVVAGFQPVWQQDFLSVYQKPDTDPAALAQTGQLLVPENITMLSAQTDRVVNDIAFQQLGNYGLKQAVADELPPATVYFPFADLLAQQVSGAVLTNSLAAVTRQVPPGDYQLTIPGLSSETFMVPATVSYQLGTVSITFPQLTIEAAGQQFSLPKLPDTTFEVEPAADQVTIFIDDVGVILNQGQTAWPVLKLDTQTPIELGYAVPSDNQPSTFRFTLVGQLEPDWAALTQSTSLVLSDADTVTVTTDSAPTNLDLKQQPSRNCSLPWRGQVSTRYSAASTAYQADKFGVNCNSFVFEYESPSADYLLNIAGNNRQGRGVKLFVNYAGSDVMPEAFMFDSQEFDQTIALTQVADDSRARFTLNWEVRSFGKNSLAELRHLRLVPFPLQRVAKLELRPVDFQGEVGSAVTNALRISEHHSWLDSLHQVDVVCDRSPCYLSLDQSYDDLWIAVSLNSPQLLPHTRLNNWANLWLVNQTGTVLIVYVPELVSLLSLGGLVVGMIALAWLSRHSSRPTQA